MQTWSVPSQEGEGKRFSEDYLTVMGNQILCLLLCVDCGWFLGSRLILSTGLVVVTVRLGAGWVEHLAVLVKRFAA